MLHRTFLGKDFGVSEAILNFCKYWQVLTTLVENTIGKWNVTDPWPFVLYLIIFAWSESRNVILGGVRGPGSQWSSKSMKVDLACWVRRGNRCRCSLSLLESCAGIFKQSMGARNRVEIGLSHRPARNHIGGRKWFLGIDSWDPEKFRNSGSWSILQTNSCAHCCRGSFMQYCWQSINQRQDKNPPGLSCLSSRYRYGHERGGGGGDTRVGNFRQKNYSTEDGQTEQLVCSGGIPAVTRNRKLSKFRSEQFRRGEKC